MAEITYTTTGAIPAGPGLTPGQLDPFGNTAGSVGRDLSDRQTRAPDCYAPQYFTASWKGVQFYVDSTSDEFGRRGDIYEYPLSDNTGYKDLGRRARRFKMEGYLIGTNQADLTTELVNMAESDNAGTLVHPLYGNQLVACITLTVAADYVKDKKRTKLSFEFVEANPSMAPYVQGQSPSTMFNNGHNALTDSLASGNPVFDSSDPATLEMAGNLTNSAGTTLQQLLAANPPTGQLMVNSQDALSKALPTLELPPVVAATPTPQTGGGMVEFRGLATMAAVAMATPAMAPAAATSRTTAPAVAAPFYFPTLESVIDPISMCTALIRQQQGDVLGALKEFNAYVVEVSENTELTDSVQSLIVSTRLCIIRDLAIAAMHARYTTIKEAMDDLDLIVAMCDDEEEIATRRCDDVLVNAIRLVRATACSAILAVAIQLPGIHEYPTNGQWPSLVVAHKLYNDARRYQQVENYNRAQNVFFMGRSVIAPAS